MDKTEAYLATLETLRRELTELDDRTKQLREAIRVIERLVPQDDLFVATSGVQRRYVVDLTKARLFANHSRIKPDLAKVSMIQAAETVLRDTGRPMHVMEILQEMLARGFPYEGEEKGLRASLTGSMERKDVFRRESPATYALSVWPTNGQGAEEKAGVE